MRVNVLTLITVVFLIWVMAGVTGVAVKEVLELESDGEELDWFSEHHVDGPALHELASCLHTIEVLEGETVRDALRRAMKEGG